MIPGGTDEIGGVASANAADSGGDRRDGKRLQKTGGGLVIA